MKTAVQFPKNNSFQPQNNKNVKINMQVSLRIGAVVCVVYYIHLITLVKIQVNHRRRNFF